MTTNAILVEGLTKRFGSVAALDGIDFEVPVGSVFGLLGPNGAGKTTAVRVLATVLHPDGGRAEVLGHDVVKDPDGVRLRIGLAGQSAAVDPNLTGRENLQLIGKLAQLARPLIDPRAAELLERFELSDAADRPLRTYSGGMRRRLDVAAALVQKPPVLFLDEPTTGLDLHSRNELWEMIRELVADGTTVLLTTQYLEEADRLAERVAVVDGGHVIANDARAIRAESLLSGLAGGHVERENEMIRVTTEDGSRLLMEVLRTLDAQDLAPAKLAVREPSLDDVFLSLTGHRAETETADAPEGARADRGAA